MKMIYFFMGLLVGLIVSDKEKVIDSLHSIDVEMEIFLTLPSTSKDSIYPKRRHRHIDRDWEISLTG